MASSVPTITIPNFSQLVSIKLTETNYLLWHAQIKPFLLGQHYWPYIDGIIPCPPPYLSIEDQSKSAINPAYTAWIVLD